MTSSHSFSYLQYTSLQSTHTLVLAFSALFLPRSTLLIAPLPEQQSSLDKPQLPFLVPITASPVWTLVWLCVGTGACQSSWAGWMRLWWHDADTVARNDTQKLKALRDAWTNTLIISVLFHGIVVFFGAPIASHIPHTYLLSLLIALLTIFVPSYTLSLPLLSLSLPAADARWPALFLTRVLTAPLERALVYPVLGAFLGAWAGAFPIPLDWDRPWQAWPLTPAYGALAGHIAGAWGALVVNAVLFFAREGREMQVKREAPKTVSPMKKRRKAKED